MIDNSGAVTVALASATVLGFILALRRNGRNGKGTDKKLAPSMPALPLIGSLPFLRGGMDQLPEKFLQVSKTLGPVFSFYAGRNLAFVLSGKQAIVDALLKHGEAFADRPNLWTEANVLNVELRGLGYTHYNEAFKKYRKLTLSILREFGFGINQESDVRIWNEVEKLIKTIDDYKSLPFDPRVLITRSTANVVMNIVFGKEFQLMEKHLHNVIDNAHKFNENIDPATDMAPLLRFLPLYQKKISKMQEAKEIMFDCLEMAIKLIKSNKEAESSFVKRFLEIEGPNYDHQDLLFLLRDLCLGSSDTVSLTLLWAMVEMANHPEVRTRVQKEIDKVVPGNRFPSYDDKPLLPYTEATLLEIARIHTLAPFGVPHATLKDTAVLGFFVPKGCLVIPSYFSAHMDPDTWTDPKNFRPERFLDEDQNVVGRESVMQFGIGKRSCPGEALAKHEVFVFFSSLMQHFDLLPPDGQASIAVVNDSGLTVGPTPFEIKFLTRKKN